MKLELRDYQKDAIVKVKNSFENGKRSPCLVLPTGAGKTIIAGDITRRTILNDKQVLFLTHREEIMKQTLKKFYDSFGIICGQIATGKPLTRNNVQVGMIQTVANRLNVLRFKPDLIIADEYHHFLAKSFLKVINHFGDVRRLGLTATPERLDGRGLCDISDDLIIGTSISELVKNESLAYPRIFMPEKDYDYHLKHGDFDKDEQYERMTKKVIVGNVIEHYRKYLNGNPAACFCLHHKHMKEIYDVFNDAKIKAVQIYSGMSDSDRENALKGIADGTYNVILSVDILGEGVDVPGLHGVIQLRKTTSLGLHLQQCGRALRLADGKECAYILDHCGNTKIHGHVLCDRDWSLDHGKRNFKKDKVPKTTTCPKCAAVFPGEPKKCFDCGFVFADNENISNQQRKTPIEIEGELKEFLPEGFEGFEQLLKFTQKAQGMDAKTRGKAALAMAYSMKDKAAIAAMAKVIGYKKGWTDIAWKIIHQNRG